MIGCSDSGSRDKLEHEVTRKTVKEICQNKGLKFLGFGGGGPYDIRVLSLSFKTYEKFNVDEARELLIYCGEQFLSNINANEKIKPLLHNYPFTGNNIEIRIGFCKDDGHEVDSPYIAYGGAIEGVVTYYINNQFNRYEEVFEETYDVALKKVKAKQESKTPDK
ncbi:MAG: hypothetical protein HZB76_07320 [Chlamydiae bacterium]|nr:hypothetical protein [Chlamydiota bacterium]